MPTVAHVIGATLARAGAHTAFTSGRGDRQSAGERGLSAPASVERTLVDALGQGGLRVVHAGRGAAACLMAAVTGLLTDAPGVAVLAGCDGEGEIAGALAQAWRDRAPLVAVTNRTLEIPGEGAVKASLVVSADAAAHWSAHACQLALTEPRGPVHLVVTPGTAAAPAVPLATAVRPAPLAVPDRVTLDGAADLLGQAQRPILIAGRQCRTLDVATWLRALAESLPAPVLVTLHGKGALPDPHPLHLGVIGATSPDAIVQRADLAVMVGLDPAELAAGRVPASLPALRLAASAWTRPEDPPRMEVVGDIASLIEELAPRLRGRARADWDVGELDRLKRAIGVSLMAPGATNHPSITAAVRVVREATPAGTIAVVAADEATDAIVALWQVVAPGELLVPASPCLPGFALPAALAAGLARPQARVVCFAGAGEVLQAEPELDMAVKLALPVLLVLVGQAGGVPAETLRRLVSERGWMAARADDPVSMGVAIERALAAQHPAILDARG